MAHLYGPAVRCKSVWTGRALQVGYDGGDSWSCSSVFGPLKGAIAPGHHGYPRTPDLIRV